MSTPKAPSGHFTVLYFASAASYTKKSVDHLSAPLPVSELFKTLEAKYPGIQSKILDACALTVNLDYVDLEEEAAAGEKGKMIQERDEVAIIPPVSSG